MGEFSLDRRRSLRHDALVEDALDYARAVATDDVRETLDWLTSNGFAVASSRGGRGESFGNILLKFGSNDDVRVTIVRDRSQWTAEIGRVEPSNRSLNVLLTAMTGELAPPEHRATSEPRSDQLPEGTVWRSSIPALIEWLRSDDRTAAIHNADERWRAVMRKWWKEVDKRS